MKKRISCIFVLLLLIFTSIHASQYMIFFTKANNQNQLDAGFLIKQDGVTILYQNGSCYEMGFQHGYLLKEEIEENYRAFLYNVDDELYKRRVVSQRPRHGLREHLVGIAVEPLIVECAGECGNLAVF